MEHFVQAAILCCAESEVLLKNRNPRKYWVHPYNANRDENESFKKFYTNIRRYEDKFFTYYRMSIKTFDILIEILRPHLTKKNTMMRNPISVEKRVTITLRYLSTGSTFTALQYEFYVGRSTIAKIVSETCQAIWLYMKDTEMPEPTEEDWLKIAETFHEKTDFPNCLGAIDGKHVRCIKPRNSSSKYFNCKKYFSVVLMAVADANLCFTAIDVGAYGQEGDSTIFRDSPLGEKIYSGKLNIPAPRNLPNADTQPLPFVFVGDEAFRLHINLLRPYPRRNLDAQKRVFNYHLTRSRHAVECAFGILANKWRIFHTPILVRPDGVDEIVKACCILHNFVRKRDGYNFEENMEEHPFLDHTEMGLHSHPQGVTIREQFANYFMGIGAVSFQEGYKF